jgi:hypothetical protein
MNIAKHFMNIFEIAGSTLFILGLISGIAVWKIRDYLANTGLLVLIFPLVLFLSMTVQYVFTVHEFYAPKKMAEWLMWTIGAGTIGTTVGIAIVVMLSRLWERPQAG